MPTTKISAACERLERRLALAGLFSFTDVDGDRVTVKTSKGGNADLAAALTLSGGTSGQLQAVNLAANPAFVGTDFTVTVKKAGGGDGFAAVGHIDATNVDVGKISIRGDLGRIVAGDTDPATPGVASLSVASLGRYGTTTGAPDLASGIRGDLKTLKIDGDVQQARVTLIGGGIGTVTIGGSLVGGAADDSGRIAAASIGSLRVGVSIVGAGGTRSGSISSGNAMGNVSVGDSIIGGGGPFSGSIVAATEIRSLKVGRDVAGGAGGWSAYVGLDPQGPGGNGIGNVTIGGSLIGGAGFGSAALQPIYGGAAGASAVTVRGDVRGGDGEGSGYLAILQAKTVSIGGSVLGGSQESSGALLLGKVGSFTARGSVVGGSGKASGSISAPLDTGTIGTILIGGSLSGGTGNQSGAVTSAGSVGKVTVRGAIAGGDGESSGVVAAAVLDSASVSGNVTGGLGVRSGGIRGYVMKRISVGGSLVGGAGASSGSLWSQSQTDDVAIAKDQIGGTGTSSGMILGGSITKATVGGSVVGGSGAGSAMIGAYRNLTSLTVKGGMVGTSANLPLQVVAAGLQGGSGIGTVTVRGSVSATVFLAGWEPDDGDGFANPSNGNASIGKVDVKGSFSASSIAAGVNSPLFPRFGTQLDSTIPGGTACAIGSVIIGGTATGSGDVGQHFGIVSRQVGSVKVKGVAIAIPAANGSTPVGNTGNFVVRVITV